MTKANAILATCISLIANCALANDDVAPSAVTAHSVGFDTILRQALSTSHKIKQSEVGVEVAGIQIIGARSSFFPKVDISASSQRIKSFGNIPSVDSLVLNGAASANYATAKLNVGWNIYNGGADSAALKLAKEKAQEALLQLRLERQEIAIKAVTAYHDLKQAQLDLRISELELELADKKFKKLELEFKNGRTSALALAEIEFEKRKKEKDRKSALRKKISALKNLALITGNQLDSESAVGLIDDDLDYEKVLSSNGFDGDTVASKIDISSSKIKQSQFAAKQSISRFLPKIEVYARLDHAGVSASKDNLLRTLDELTRDKSYFGISVSWNLFDGFDSYAHVKEKAKEILASQEAYDLAREEKQREIYDLEQSAADSDDAILLEQSKLKLLREKLNIHKLEIELGRRSNVDFSETNTNYYIQQLYVKASEEKFNYLRAKMILAGFH